MDIQCTKTCFVLLERLDNEILDRYSQKYGMSSKTPIESKCTLKDWKKQGSGRALSVESYSIAHTGRKRIREDSGSAQDSMLKADLTRRKRKVRARPLYYTDDEEECSWANPKENILEETRGAKLSPPLGEFQNSEKNSGSKIKTSRKKSTVESSEKNSISNDNAKTIEKTRSGLISKNILESSVDETACAEKQPKSYIQASEVKLQEDVQNSEKMDCIVNNNNNNYDNNNYNVCKMEEVEIMEDYKCSSFEMTVNWDEEKISDCASNPKQEFEDDDSDARDEGEDDRATVVFDKSFNDSATDFGEVLEVGEKKIRTVAKKFRKKKITNRKKRPLVKFKRKMIGRNLARVKKLKNKYSEVSISGGLFVETATESVNDCYVREVSGLVRRLHELYIIILQLQKNLPIESEQGNHFTRSIAAQQENFRKEIKRIQQIIIRGYDRMLSSFGNASTVSKEIGKRTSLSKEDIASVISQCTLLDGYGEKKKATGTEEQELNRTHQPSPGPLGLGGYSKKRKTLINDKTETLLSVECGQKEPLQPVQLEQPTKEAFGNAFKQPGPKTTPDLVSVPPPQSLPTTGNPRLPESLQRPNNKPIMPIPGGNHSTTALPQMPSGPFFGVSLPNRNNSQAQWPVHPKPLHYFSQKNYTHRTHAAFRDPRFRHFPQQPPMNVHGNLGRPLSSQPLHTQPNTRAQYQGLLPHGSGTSPVNFPPNGGSGFFQAPAGFVLPRPPTAGKSPRLPLPPLMDINPYPSGYNQGRLPTQHFPQVPDPCSLGPGIRPLLLLPTFDRSRPGSIPNGCQKKSNYWTKSSDNIQRPIVSSSWTAFESNVAPTRAFPEEEPCPLGTALTNFTGFIDPNAPKQTQVAVTQLPAHPEQVSSLSAGQESSGSYALDPTVPQKLTMRNRKLEAGPILRVKGESLNSEGENQLRESMSDAASDSEASKSRVYVCAQNGCKNPGVRVCKGCLSIIYCSETCQLKHWSLKHKTECYQLKELRG